MSVARPSLTEDRTALTVGSLLKQGLIGGAIAAVGNLIVYAIALGMGIPLRIPATPGAADLTALSPVPVVISSLIPAIGAALLLALLARFVARPRFIFLIVAGIFLALSFVPVLSLPVAASAQVTLGLMHIVAGAAIVWALTSTGAEG